MPLEGPLIMEHTFSPLVAESIEFKRVSGAGFKRFKQNAELDVDSVAYWKRRCLAVEKEFGAFKASIENILILAADKNADKFEASQMGILPSFEAQLAQIRVSIQILKENFSIERRPRDGNNHVNSLKTILTNIHSAKCDLNQRHFAESNQIQELELQAQHLETVIIPASQPIQPNHEYPYKLVDPTSSLPQSEFHHSKITEADSIRILNDLKREILKTSVHKEPPAASRTPLTQKNSPTLTRTRTPTSIMRKSSPASLTQNSSQLHDNDKDDNKLFKHLIPIPPLKHRHSSPLIDPRRAKAQGSSHVVT